MAVDQVRQSLWTPDGPHDLQQKDVIQINRMELITLSRLHEFAQKYGVSVVCKRCDVAITGLNNDSTKEPAVACRCREWRYIP